jgi:putative transposase
MPKQATAQLSEREREALTRLPRKDRSEQQVVLRARIISVATQSSANIQIAGDFHINVDTVRLVRDRRTKWQATEDLATVNLAQRLQNASRSGALPKFTPKQRTPVAALASDAPTKTGRPIRKWTGKEIANELKARGIVTDVSPRPAGSPAAGTE